MNKGFTLIELLAVMTLLSIIALITIPIVLKTIDKAEYRTLELSGNLYIKAVEKAIVEKNEDIQVVFSPTKCKVNSNGNILCDDSLEEIMIKTSGDRPSSGQIIFEDGSVIDASLVFGEQLILMSSDGSFVLWNDKYVCNRVIASSIGKIPQGNYDVGDEYICQVSDGLFYNFFVLNNDGENVSLIMDSNLGEIVSWCMVEYYDTNEEWSYNSCSANGAIETLNFNTSDWTNLQIIRKTIPTAQQIATASGDVEWNDMLYEGNVTLPDWLYTNNGIYWTSTNHTESTDGAWYVSSEGKLEVGTSGTLWKKYVRPVIVVSKSSIE